MKEVGGWRVEGAELSWSSSGWALLPRNPILTGFQAEVPGSLRCQNSPPSHPDALQTTSRVVRVASNRPISAQYSLPLTVVGHGP